MIKRIIFALITFCLFIAIPLAIAGYDRVELGAPTLAFIRQVSLDTQNFTIAIPDIPSIPTIMEGTMNTAILGFLNGMITIVNGVIAFLNLIINIVNVVIKVLEFIFFIIRDLIVYKDSLGSPEPYTNPYIFDV